jgi:methionyl-tRNA synthetase
MPNPPSKFYLTTPIYYVNARPHIGHAYSTIAADVIARRHRLLGDDTFFLTGTDEHGQKVQRSAEAAGIPPQQFADEVSATFRNLWKRMGITNDDYIRTTDERHKKGVQALWTLLEERGAIYLSSYTGQYCVSEEIFVEGPPGTIGPDGKPTETVTEENYFFRLSDYQLPLINLIESGELHIQPETSKNEILSFLRGNVNEVMATASEYASDFHEEVGKLSGEELLSFALDSDELALSNAKIPYVPGALRDLSISRTTFDWGVPVPGNPKHVMYVWLDALANYMTAVGYGSDDPADQTKFGRYWPADLHLVGKEITRQHCIYWPAFLIALRPPEIPEPEWNTKWLPKSVIANGWLLFEESKMSKSRGNVVRTETILDAFGNLVYASVYPNSTHEEQDLFASDVIRYFLLREIPFGQDGSFSFDALITRYNADLANGYGNLVSRTLSMIEKYFDGVIPDYPGREVPWLTAALTSTLEIAPVQMTAYSFSRYLELMTTAITSVDAEITSMAPWKIAATIDSSQTGDARRFQLAQLLHGWYESIRIITGALYPVMPFAAASVWRQLGLGSIEEAARNGELRDLQWGGLKPGTKLGPLAPIFPRADKGLAQIMTDMENPITPAPQTPESVKSVAGSSPEPAAEKSVLSVSSVLSSSPAETATPTITIDDFAKIDLRVAQIVVAERIPKADKLLRLEVDLGPNHNPSRRQILSGIAEFYTPEELIGKRIAIIANLAPRKMRGLESHGMLLAASGDSDAHSSKPILATFSDEIALGSKIR